MAVINCNWTPQKSRRWCAKRDLPCRKGREEGRANPAQSCRRGRVSIVARKCGSSGKIHVHASEIIICCVLNITGTALFAFQGISQRRAAGAATLARFKRSSARTRDGRAGMQGHKASANDIKLIKPGELEHKQPTHSPIKQRGKTHGLNTQASGRLKRRGEQKAAGERDG